MFGGFKMKDNQISFLVPSFLYEKLEKHLQEPTCEYRTKTDLLRSLLRSYFQELEK